MLFDWCIVFVSAIHRQMGGFMDDNIDNKEFLKSRPDINDGLQNIIDKLSSCIEIKPEFKNPEVLLEFIRATPKRNKKSPKIYSEKNTSPGNTPENNNKLIRVDPSEVANVFSKVDKDKIAKVDLSNILNRNLPKPPDFEIPKK